MQFFKWQTWHEEAPKLPASLLPENKETPEPEGKGLSKKKTAKLVSDAIAELMGKLPGMLDERINPLREEVKAGKPVAPAVPAAAAVPGQQDQYRLPPEITGELLQNKNRIADLEKVLKEQKVEREAAEQRALEVDRRSQVRQLGDQFSFVSPTAKDSFLRLVDTEVKRLQDGTLVAGPQGLPLDVFAQEAAKIHDYFLSPVPVEGAGATRGQIVRPGVATMEMIGPHMKPEDRAAAVAEIGRVLALQAAQ